MNPEISSLQSRGLRMVTRNFTSDAGGFGSIFKVKPLKKSTENLVEVMVGENPDLDHLSKETWVLKVVRSLKTKSETDKGREYGLIRNLDHPNIIKILEVWEEPVLNFPEEVIIFYLMEYANRRSLRYWIQNWKNSRDVYPIILDVLDGLTYLHSEGIIHRDLKPENILLTIPYENALITTVKICDFGLATKADRSQFSVRRGTRGYIAPEIAKGKCSKKVDMFSVGVTFTELVSTCNPSLIQRYIVEATTPGVVFCPLEFNNMNPAAITIEEATLASLVTSWNPEERLSASDFRNCLYTYRGKIIRDRIPFYDISPKQLKYVGRPDNLLDWETVMKHWNIRNKFNLDIITTAIFRYVNINYPTVIEVLRNCPNLEYVEIVGENKEKHGVPFLTTTFFEPGTNLSEHSEIVEQDEWHPHRKLKTFIFHQLNPNYTEKSLACMDRLDLKNIFYFLPWPFETWQLERNQMIIKIRLGKHLVVSIDPEKKYFHVSGNLGKQLCSRQEYCFERVTIKDLEPIYIGRHKNFRNQTCEGNEIDLKFDPLMLTKLILINTTTRLFNCGRVFEKFKNLEELHFTGEQVWESLGYKRPFDIQFLTQNLRKLFLETVRILPLNPNAVKRKLDYFGICNSQLPPNFRKNYPEALEVRKIAFIEFVEVENGEMIGFAMLKSIFESAAWEEISLTNFSWKAYTTETIDFKNSLEHLFRTSKISVGQSSLQFSRNLSGEIQVKQIPQYIHQNSIIEEDDFNDFSTPDNRIFLEAVPAFSIPEEGSAIQKLINATPQDNNNKQVDGKYFFDGGEGFNDVPFKFHGKKELREIYIRNGKIGNLTNQLRGCVNLETLILEQIQLNTFTRIGKCEFHKLKKFHWIEFQNEWSKLSLERLESIIFFEKDGYRNLCEKGKNIVISVKDRMNIVFSLERKELILQHFEGEDTHTLLTSMVCNEGSSVKSLVLGGCTFSNIPSLIPLHLTSLHLHLVEGARFHTIVALINDNKFPCLMDLSVRHKRTELEDVDLAIISSQKFRKLLLGGMRLDVSGTAAAINVGTLILADCLLSNNVLTYTKDRLDVDRLLFIGGSVREPSFEELEAVQNSSLTWVGFQRFRTVVGNIVSHSPEMSAWLKEDLNTEKVSERKKALQWLEGISDAWSDSNEANINFLLTRTTPAEKWESKCMAYIRKEDAGNELFRVSFANEDIIKQFDTMSGRDKLSRINMG